MVIVRGMLRRMTNAFSKWIDRMLPLLGCLSWGRLGLLRNLVWFAVFRIAGPSVHALEGSQQRPNVVFNKG